MVVRVVHISQEKLGVTVKLMTTHLIKHVYFRSDGLSYTFERLETVRDCALCFRRLLPKNRLGIMRDNEVNQSEVTRINLLFNVNLVKNYPTFTRGLGGTNTL